MQSSNSAKCVDKSGKYDKIYLFHKRASLLALEEEDLPAR